MRRRLPRSLGETLAYTYDPAGNLAAITDPKDQVKKYTYDDAGSRAGESHFLTATDTTAAKTITYGYNDLNQPTGYTDGTTQGTTNYDAKQLRKTGETVNYGPFKSEQRGRFPLMRRTKGLEDSQSLRKAP